MPSIESRTITHQLADTMLSGRPAAPKNHPPAHAPESSLSLPGNLAPLRGTIPIEFMNDADIRRYYPDGPYFLRSFVDSTIYVRNLALQALNP